MMEAKRSARAQVNLSFQYFLFWKDLLRHLSESVASHLKILLVQSANKYWHLKMSNAKRLLGLDLKLSALQMPWTKQGRAGPVSGFCHRHIQSTQPFLTHPERLSCYSKHHCLQVFFFFISIVSIFVKVLGFCFVVVSFLFAFFFFRFWLEKFSKVQNSSQLVFIPNCLYSFFSVWLYLGLDWIAFAFLTITFL